MKKKKTKNWPVVAICYDFDKTLSPKDMQEYTLFPKLDISAQDFWSESNEFAEKNSVDKMLSYMKLIVKIAKEKEEDLSLTEKDFPEMGKEVELFEGLDTWFDRINQYASEKELLVEHYIISAGLKEIIQGTSIACHFKEIYASCFCYTASGIPIWPKQVVNGTQKTQYLFRINKDCLNLSDEESLNMNLPDELRRIPFRNFIYLGDSITDIPAMKVVKKEKGLAIGVYNPKTQSPSRMCELFDGERIDFFAPADYQEGNALESYVKKGIDQIKTNEELTRIGNQQGSFTLYLERIRSVAQHFESIVKETIDVEDIVSIKKDATHLFKTAKKVITENYKGDCLVCDDVIKIIDEYKNIFENCVKNRKKELSVKNKTSVVNNDIPTGGVS